MLIDVHGHFTHAFPSGVPPARIALYAGTCNIDFVLVSNRDAASCPEGAADLDEVDANTACLAASQTHARLAPLYWVRPGRVDSHVAALVGALASEPFTGIVFAPAENGFAADDRLLEPYLGALGPTACPALFCVSADEQASPGKVYEQARRHPQLPIVLCVCGSRSPRAEAMDVALHAQRQADANLYLDTSHADAVDVVGAVQALGADRVLFGSDALSRGGTHIPLHIALLDELRSSLPLADFRKVTGDNAARLFRLPQARG